MKVWPPIVSVPERAPPEFACALYCTVPLPLPFPPAVTLSHGALLVAVHEQPLPLVTEKLPLPPPAGTLALFGEIETEHPPP